VPPSQPATSFSASPGADTFHHRGALQLPHLQENLQSSGRRLVRFGQLLANLGNSLKSTWAFLAPHPDLIDQLFGQLFKFSAFLLIWATKQCRAVN